MRHKKTKKRHIKPDNVYKNRLVAKFTNKLMRDGKKHAVQKIMYRSLDIIREKSNQDPIVVFEKAIVNVGPKMEVRPRRVGGASYQIPVEVRGDRKTSLAIRWIIQAAKSRSNKEYHRFEAKLAQEFLDASQNMGEAIKKRDAVLRMAEANRAFAHFRW